MLMMTHTPFSQADDPGAGGAGAAPAVAEPVAATPSAPAATDMQGATVPYTRFSEVVSERNGHRARAEELVQTLSARESRIAELESQLVGQQDRESAWAQEKTNFENALDGLRAEFSERWQLSEELGIKDLDVIDHGRRKLGEMPEDGRPESLVDAFKGWKENIDTCPPLLRPHLSTRGSTPNPASASPARPAARSWPDPKAGTAPPPAPTPPAQQEWTREQYREARKRGWSTSQIMRARMGQS